MGRVILGLDPLDDPVLDVVKRRRVRWRLITHAAPRARQGQSQIGRKLIDVQDRKNFQRRAVVMGCPLEAIYEAAERGLRSQFHRPTA